MNRALDGILGVGLGAYLIAVVLKGNSKTLINYLGEEVGYLEFLTAIYLLYLLHGYGPTQKITDALMIGAIFAVVLKAVTNSGISGVVDDFANGRKSLFETLQAIIEKD